MKCERDEMSTLFTNSSSRSKKVDVLLFLVVLFASNFWIGTLCKHRSHCYDNMKLTRKLQQKVTTVMNTVLNEYYRCLKSRM